MTVNFAPSLMHRGIFILCVLDLAQRIAVRQEKKASDLHFPQRNYPWRLLIAGSGRARWPVARRMLWHL
jgi:hypothetical protein